MPLTRFLPVTSSCSFGAARRASATRCAGSSKERSRRVGLGEFRSLAALFFLVLLADITLADVPADMATAQELFNSAQRLEEETPSARTRIEAGYRSAAEAFREIYERDHVISPRLFTNVGNAYYFAGDVADASLWYARALLLDPDEPGARTGRLLVRKQLPWRPPTSVGADLLGTLFFWHQHLRFRSREGLFLIFWPLAFGMFALARRRRWALWPGLLCLTVGGALLGSLSLSASDESGRDLGVVRVAALGRSGDSKIYSLSHSAPLPAGSEVHILEDRGAWIHVSLPDGSGSWLPTESIARVLPR